MTTGSTRGAFSSCASTTPTIPPSPAPLPLTAWRAASSRRKSSIPIRAIYGRSGCTTPLSFNMGAVQDVAGSSSEGRPTPRLERIAILAGGVCTPIGQDVDAFWSALLTGADGISRIERFPVDDLRVGNGGEIKKLTRAIEWSRVPDCRASRLLVSAADDLLSHAGARPLPVAPERLAVVVGTALGGVEEGERALAGEVGRLPRALYDAPAHALKRWLGARRVPVNSIKGAIGHTMGAAATLEAILCLLAGRHGQVPATLGLEELDPACELDLIQGAPRALRPRLSLSTSLGFGGCNAALVLQ